MKSFTSPVSGMNAWNTCCMGRQAATIAEEVLKYNPDAVRVLYNKFYSAISFKPTISTVLTPEVGPGSLPYDRSLFLAP